MHTTAAELLLLLLEPAGVVAAAAAGSGGGTPGGRIEESVDSGGCALALWVDLWKRPLTLVSVVTP